MAEHLHEWEWLELDWHFYVWSCACGAVSLHEPVVGCG